MQKPLIHERAVRVGAGSIPQQTTQLERGRDARRPALARQQRPEHTIDRQIAQRNAQGMHGQRTFAVHEMRLIAHRHQRVFTTGFVGPTSEIPVMIVRQHRHDGVGAMQRRRRLRFGIFGKRLHDRRGATHVEWVDAVSPPLIRRPHAPHAA